MVKVRFLQDFGGRETKEQFFRKGEEWEFESEIASRLVADGRAEYVKVIEAEKPKKKVKDE